MRALAAPGCLFEPRSKLAMRNGMICDRKTGVHGVLYVVGAVHPVDGDTVDVEGGGQSAGMSGDYGIFRVVKRNGEWRVLRYTMTRQL